MQLERMEGETRPEFEEVSEGQGYEGFGARKGSGQFQSRASSFETCRPL